MSSQQDRESSWQDQIFTPTNQGVECKFCKISNDYAAEQSRLVHINSFQHQEQVHKFALEKLTTTTPQKEFENNNSQLFVLKDALKKQKKGQGNLHEYIDCKIKEVLINHEFKPATYQTYKTILRSYYLMLFNMGQDHVTKPTILMFLQDSKKRETLSVLKLLMRCHGITFNQQEIKQLKMERTQREDEKSCLTKDIFDVQFLKLIGFLNQMRQYKLPLVLTVMKELKLTFSDLQSITYNDLQQQVFEIHYFQDGVNLTKIIENHNKIIQEAKQTQEHLNVAPNNYVYHSNIRSLQQEIMEAKQLIKNFIGSNIEQDFELFLNNFYLHKLRSNQKGANRVPLKSSPSNPESLNNSMNSLSISQIQENNKKLPSATDDEDHLLKSLMVPEQNVKLNEGVSSQQKHKFILAQQTDNMQEQQPKFQEHGNEHSPIVINSSFESVQKSALKNPCENDQNQNVQKLTKQPAVGVANQTQDQQLVERINSNQFQECPQVEEEEKINK